MFLNMIYLGGNESFGERRSRAAPASDMDRRQVEMPALFEFVDHAPGSKCFKLPGIGTPVPVAAYVFGYLVSAPVWMFTNNIA